MPLIPSFNKLVASLNLRPIVYSVSSRPGRGT